MSFAGDMTASSCLTGSCPMSQGLQGSGTSAELTCSIHDGFGRLFSSSAPWFRGVEAPVCDRPVECGSERSSSLL